MSAPVTAVIAAESGLTWPFVHAKGGAKTPKRTEMHMMTTRLTLASTLALLLVAPAFAQETATPESPAAEAPATGDALAAPGDLSLGTPAGDGIGSQYVAASFEAWEQRCIRTEDGADPCQLYQLMNDDTGNPVAEISLFNLPEGGEAAAGATIVVPLETLLTANLRMSVDGGEAKVYPFSWCAQMGCIARVGFTEAEVGQFRAGAEARLTIVPVVAPDQEVTATLSLAGFTAGFEAVTATNPTPPPAE
jgi:invasion protein IalB